MSSQFAVELARIERRLINLELAGRLNNASLDGGFLPIYDDDGELRGRIGQQPDGSVTVVDVNAPPPVPPSPPVVTPAQSSLVIEWDGQSSDFTPWAADFRYVEVHVSIEAGFLPTDATQVATIMSTKGGRVGVGGLTAEQDHYVKFVAVNTSGKESDPSEEVVGTPTAAVDSAALSDLQTQVDAADQAAADAQTAAESKSRVWVTDRESVEPSGPFKDDDMWLVQNTGRVYTRKGTGWVTYLVGGASILDNAIATAKIKDNAITAAKIGAGEVVAGKIAADAVSASNIIADAIQAIHIAAAQIQAEHIAAEAVTTDHLAANAVTADKIDVNYVYAGEVDAGQITGVSLAADLAVVGSLSIGSAITMTPENGILISSPVGDTHFPADGSRGKLAGDMTASSLEVQGSLLIRGQTNEIAKGAWVTLGTGVADPQASPILTSAYMSTALYEGGRRRGWAAHPYYGGYWLTTDSPIGTAYLDEIDLNGNLIDTTALPTLGGDTSKIVSALGGVARIGSYAYVLCQTTDTRTTPYQSWYVYKFLYTAGSGWSYSGRWKYEPATYLGGGSAKEPTIGSTTAGTLAIMQAGSGDGHWVTTYATSNAHLATQRIEQADGTHFKAARNSAGLVHSPADIGDGQTYWWLVHQTYGWVYCFNASTGLRVEAHEFPAPSTDNRGLYWDGTRFISTTGDQILRYSKIKDNDLASNPIKAGYSWRRNDPNAPYYAAAETAVSPEVSNPNHPKRAWIWVKTTTIPDDTADPYDPDSVTIYIGRGSGQLYSSAYPNPGVTEVTLDSIDISGKPPESAQYGFFDSYPAEVRSAGTDYNGDPTIQLVGDGSGHLGPLRWDADGSGQLGSMIFNADGSDGNDTGWVWLGGYSVAGFSLANIKYRRIGTQVWFSGQVTNNTGAAITTTNGNITPDVTVAGAGTFPVDVRPTDPLGTPWYMQAFYSGVSTWWWRINGDGSIQVTNGASSASWANGTTLTLQGHAPLL